MRRNKKLFQELTQVIGLEDEALPGVPLVEIWDQRRVLVENHHGVIEYGRCQVLVKVRFGILCVCGENLHLARMNKAQLVITGKICAVQFRGKG